MKSHHLWIAFSSHTPVRYSKW